MSNKPCDIEYIVCVKEFRVPCVVIVLFLDGVKTFERREIDLGELIEEIRLARRLLKRQVSSVDELRKKSLKELQTIFRQLEAELE